MRELEIRMDAETDLNLFQDVGPEISSTVDEELTFFEADD